MKMGVIPYETCLSYRSGLYRQCLLACHDANNFVMLFKLMQKKAENMNALFAASMSYQNSLSDESTADTERIILQSGRKEGKRKRRNGRMGGIS